MRTLLISIFSFILISGLLSCSDSAPATSNVQYLITNRSTRKINRLTVFLQQKDTTTIRLIDSVFITNIPDNLPIRLTYDIAKNSAIGNYRLVAISASKKWTIPFGSFSAKTDNDPDHLYNLEIQEGSVVVIP